MPIASLLSALGVAAVKAEAKAVARRAARKAALGVTTALFLLLAFGFGLAALTVWLTHRVGTVPALLIVAGVALLIAGIIQLVAASGDNRRRRAPRPPPLAAAPLTGEAGEGEPPAGSVVGSMAVVAMVGFILAQKLTRRS